jgi:4-hydroxybenzoate polyprenyltransferase/phosphoserine phosphatase
VYPIVVDLDGTLVQTDMLHESALRVLRDRPGDLLKIPGWLGTGKAGLKQRLACATRFDPTALPYNATLMAWLREQRALGRRVILCTASDGLIARAIATHLDLFDAVMASDGNVNLAGTHKADALEQQFGRGGFDYVGNSRADIPVWERARRAIVVNASAALSAHATSRFDVEHVFAPPGIGLASAGQALRLHQWMKNLLLFIPLLATHNVGALASWSRLLLAFLAFSLCASAVYIANDLIDLDSDRQHPRKRHRPFASGVLPAWYGMLASPLLVAASMGLALGVGSHFVAWLLLYFVTTCLYSLVLKRLVLVDCLTLALLYTLRVVAGAAAVQVMLSFWLLAFSVFLFLSLAFLKRYAELQVQILAGKGKADGRAYLATDAPLVQILGITSAYAAVVVLALYLNSDAVVALYRAPQVVWGAVPVMLYWVSWMWLRAHRGEMHDDPLVFAVKDRASLAAGAAFAAIVACGAAGMPW